MKNNIPMVVVVMINYNQDNYTVESIKSLLNSTYENFHILLIDNGSSENVVNGLKLGVPKSSRLTVDYLSENLGYVGGINYGLAKGESLHPDFYLIMNNDTLIDINAIKNLVDVSEKHNRKVIVSGKVYNYDEKDTLQYIGQLKDPENGLNQKSIVKGKREKDIRQYEEELEMGMLDDIFWLIPTQLYQKINGYSDYFFLYGEQNDYAFRAIKAGYKLIYTPKASIWHKGGASTCGGDKKAPKIDYWTSMATLKLAVLHLPADKANKFCFYWPLKKLLKSLLLFALRKGSYEHIKCILLVMKHFRCWNKVRYKDNGYNPFME